MSIKIPKSIVKRSSSLILSNWVNTSSVLASLMFLWSILRQYAPIEFKRCISRFARQLFDVLSPYVHLHIDEFSSDVTISKNDNFNSIQAYLGQNGSKNSKKLRLMSLLGEKRILCIDTNEETVDKFDGVTVWWTFKLQKATSNTSIDRRGFELVFHKKHREFIAGKYLDHVLREGKKIREKHRTRKLYTNKVGGMAAYHHPENVWTPVEFKHPASFDTLALEPQKKREIVADLLKFRDNGEFYSRIGKAWKRGYLLYGPPGTGKSTMIAAMANLLEYDVYDLELTAAYDNSHLRRLLINTTSRSIIAIEDIDCSSNVTGHRDDKNRIPSVGTGVAPAPAPVNKRASTVTLSGLLNFVDGIWSSLGGERIIVFTTNSVSKLDPALIRAGRMDKHIELSYCGFEAFKVLAKNYLLIEQHPKFDSIKALLEVTDMTPADVAEKLFPMDSEDDADVCLENLIRALEKAKVDQDAKKAAKEQKKIEKQAKEAGEIKANEPQVGDQDAKKAGKETPTTNNK